MNLRHRAVLFIVIFGLAMMGMSISGQQENIDSEIETYIQAKAAFNRGKELFVENRVGEAEPLFEEALRIFPRFSDAYFYIAQIQFKKGDLDLALQAISDSESHFNTTNRMELKAAGSEIQENLVKQERRYFAADLYFVYGNIFFKKKDYRQAHEKYLEAVQYNPRHHQAFNNLINLHLLLDNRDLALELLKKAEASGVTVNPNLKLGVLAANDQLDNQKLWKLTLKNGQSWTGTIISRDGGIVKMKTELGEMEFHKDGIFSIELFSGETEAPPPAAIVETSPASPPQTFQPKRRERFQKLFFQLDYDFFSHASSAYRDVYGSLASFAVVNVGYRFSPRLFMRFGFHFFTEDGEVPGIGIGTRSEQKLWSLVLGYEGKIVNRFSYQVEGGAFYINYKEKVVGGQISDNAIGIRIGSGLVYRFGSSVYTVISAGYLNGSDTIGNKDVKLGGLYAGAGIGLLF